MQVQCHAMIVTRERHRSTSGIDYKYLEFETTAGEIRDFVDFYGFFDGFHRRQRVIITHDDDYELFTPSKVVAGCN